MTIHDLAMFNFCWNDLFCVNRLAFFFLKCEICQWLNKMAIVLLFCLYDLNLKFDQVLSFYRYKIYVNHLLYHSNYYRVDLVSHQVSFLIKVNVSFDKNGQLNYAIMNQYLIYTKMPLNHICLNSHFVIRLDALE